MRRGTRAALAVGAACAVAVAVTAPALAATAPTPLQIAQGYMKPVTTINQKIPLKAKPPTGKKVIFMSSGLQQQQVVSQYMKQALELAGWTLEDQIWTSSSVATVTQALSNALLKKPDYVIAPGVDPRLIPDSIKQQYLAAKVPIMVGQSCGVGFKYTPPLFPSVFMCEAVVPDAIAISNWVTADSKGTAKALLINLQPFEVLRFYNETLTATLGKVCPGCQTKTVALPFASYLSGQGPSIVVNALRANPGFTYTLWDGGAYTRGLLPALDAAGLLGKVTIAGRGLDPLAQQAMKDNQMAAFTAVAWGNEGYAYADSVFRLATQSSGLSQNAKMKIQLVTNVNIREIPDPYYVVPSNSLDQFKKLWKLS